MRSHIPCGSRLCLCQRKILFLFSSVSKGENQRGFKVGVAVADKPTGPFTPLAEPIKGINGIDPCVLIDKNGEAYIYWSGRGMYVARLKSNMTELASEPVQIKNLPEGLWKVLLPLKETESIISLPVGAR